MISKKWIVAVLMLIHLGIASYFNLEILGGIPHIPDSAMYYRQAILLTHGELFLSNFSMQPQDAFILMGHYVRDGKLFIYYPHFLPFLIAIFIKLGIPWLLNPLLSAFSLLFVFLIARKLLDENTAIIASLLYCFSPFAILMAGDYMMHSATLFFLLLAFYLVLVCLENFKIWAALIAGLSLGYAFDLRPLTAIGVFAPIGIYLLIYYRKQVFSWKNLWFVFGFGIMFALLLADNYVMTGSPLKISHPIGTFLGDPKSIVSLSNLPGGLNHTDAALSFLTPVLFHSFIPLLLLAVAVIPLFVSRKKQDVLLIGIFISIVLVYAFTYAEGLHGYGPRYYYEATFALFILAASGVLWIINQFSGRGKQVVMLILVVLLIYNIIGLAKILPQYKDYNYIPDEAVEKLKSLDLENSIVIIGKTINWFEDGITATLYDPEYKKSFFIRELENGEHLKVLEEHPEKTVYKIKKVNEIVLFNFTNSTNLNMMESVTV